MIMNLAKRNTANRIKLRTFNKRIKQYSNPADTFGKKVGFDLKT